LRRLIALSLALCAASPALADDIAASPPSDISVTIYRAPHRDGGAIELGSLGGFAVVTETRTVTLPEGRSRLRFEGVVDGILPESAIVSGLPGGVIEKNRDAALLSPSSLIRAARGKTIQLRRTNRDTGKSELVKAEIVAADADGVTFKTAAGVEALRCSGLPETFRYDSGSQGLSAKPTLSVATRSKRPVAATITLTYIAEGFDWNASYTARINPDGKTMDLGGWITLANGNSVSLADARVQIVAGGLNREYVARHVNAQPQVIARCWPQQRTHQIPLKPDRPYRLVNPYIPGDYERYKGNWIAEDGSIVVTAQRREGMLMDAPLAMSAISAAPPPPEQLGDLKLYRVSQRTTVAAMQMKQTRLLEQPGVPFERVLVLRTRAHEPWSSEEQRNPIAVLRTRNDKESKLGLPLPSGAFLIEQEHWGRAMVVGEPALGDTAEDEKVELELGAVSHVTVVRRTTERKALGGDRWIASEEVTVTNASPEDELLELRLETYNGEIISEASQVLDKELGHPLARLKLPANGTVTLRYKVADR
jgi:hypothetical protein